MAVGSLITQPPVEASKGSNWRGSQAFSGELDVTEGNETRPWTGLTAHLARFRAAAGRKPCETLRGLPGRGGEQNY
jgi:hypothetical protein